MERKPWEDSSDQEDGAELSPRLCLPGLQPGSWPSGCLGSWPRWPSATGLPRLRAGFSPGKPLLPRIFCFLIGKLKFLGKTCRFCRKSSFWWRVAPTRRVSDSRTLLPCRQNTVAWAKCPGLINGVLFALMHSDYRMKIVQKSAIQSTIIKSLRKSPLPSILAFKLECAWGQSVCVSGEGGDLPVTDASCSAGSRLMCLKDFFLVPFL